MFTFKSFITVSCTSNKQFSKNSKRGSPAPLTHERRDSLLRVDELREKDPVEEANRLLLHVQLQRVVQLERLFQGGTKRTVVKERALLLGGGGGGGGGGNFRRENKICGTKAHGGTQRLKSCFITLNQNFIFWSG